MKYLVPIAIALFANCAYGQNTGPGNPSGYSQNATNRAAQPLSPYLNLLRGGNNAVNYYYGVRPGSQPGFAGMAGQANLGPRQTFFPVVDTLNDLVGEDQRGAPRMPSTGHPVGFNNTLNYFGPTSGQNFARNAGQRRSQR